MLGALNNYENDKLPSSSKGNWGTAITILVGVGISVPLVITALCGLFGYSLRSMYESGIDWGQTLLLLGIVGLVFAYSWTKFGSRVSNRGAVTIIVIATLTIAFSVITSNENSKHPIDMPSSQPPDVPRSSESTQQHLARKVMDSAQALSLEDNYLGQTYLLRTIACQLIDESTPSLRCLLAGSSNSWAYIATSKPVAKLLIAELGAYHQAVPCTVQDLNNGAITCSNTVTYIDQSLRDR